MAWGLVQATSWNEAGTKTTLQGSFSSAPTAGNLVAMLIYYWGSGTTTIASVVDGNSNSYTVPAGSPSAFATDAGQIHCAYLLKAPANAHQTITVTFAANHEGASVHAIEVSPTSGYEATFDTYSEGEPAYGTNVNVPSVVVSDANRFAVFGVCSGASLSSIDSPWTALHNAQFGGVWAGYDLDVDSSQVAAATISASAFSSVGAMSFSEVASGGGAPAAGSVAMLITFT